MCGHCGQLQRVHDEENAAWQRATAKWAAEASPTPAEPRRRGCSGCIQGWPVNAAGNHYSPEQPSVEICRCAEPPASEPEGGDTEMCQDLAKLEGRGPGGQSNFAFADGHFAKSMERKYGMPIEKIKAACEGGDTPTVQPEPETAQIVERLREVPNGASLVDETGKVVLTMHRRGDLCRAAADRLEAQAAHIASLEAGMRKIQELYFRTTVAHEIARRALAGAGAPP